MGSASCSVAIIAISRNPFASIESSVVLRDCSYLNWLPKEIEFVHQMALEKKQQKQQQRNAAMPWNKWYKWKKDEQSINNLSSACYISILIGPMNGNHEFWTIFHLTEHRFENESNSQTMNEKKKDRNSKLINELVGSTVVITCNDNASSLFYVILLL